MPAAMLLMASAAAAQQTDHEAIDEGHIRERELRMSQQSPRALIDNGVVQRLRPGYDAAGVDLGGFRIDPKLGVQLIYDDNIFETQAAESDQEVVVTPSVSVRSTWERHALGFDASASIQRFARHPSENLENYDLSVNGVVDFGLGGHLFGLGRIAQDNESRGTIGDLFPGGQPILYRRKQLAGGIEEHLPGLFAKLDGDFARYRYDDVVYQGVTFPQAYRNRDEARITGQAALKIGPGLAFFTELTANDVQYSGQEPSADSSSHGQSILGGLTFQIPAMLSGEIGIGYLRQTYDKLSFRPVEGLSYDLSVIWNTTPLLTATVSARRAIQQTPFVQAPSIIESRLIAQLDYELLRNLLINVKATVTLDDFGGGYRVDRRYEESVSVQYLINRTLRADLTIEWRDQHAGSSFLRPYQGMAVKMGLTAQR